MEQLSQYLDANKPTGWEYNIIETGSGTIIEWGKVSQEAPISSHKLKMFCSTTDSGNHLFRFDGYDTSYKSLPDLEEAWVSQELALKQWIKLN